MLLVYILLILFAIWTVANIMNPDLGKKVRRIRIEFPKKKKENKVNLLK